MSIYTDTAIQCLRDEAEALLALIPTIGHELDEAVRLIMACTGKVIVTGVGKSGHIGAKIAANPLLYRDSQLLYQSPRRLSR